MTGIEIVFISIWVLLSGKIYLYIFAPREMLLIYGSRDINILDKFASEKTNITLQNV